MSYQFISFNPFRSIGIPFVKYIKPEHMFHHIQDIDSAKQILFPEYWQLNSLTHALKKDVFPSLSTYQLGFNKVEMTRCLMAINPTIMPKTGIFSNQTVQYNEILESFGHPFVCKEIRSSSGLGVFLIKNNEDFQYYLRSNSVVYVQEYLEFDRDLRVVIIGDKVVCSYWRVKPKGAFHSNLSRGGNIDRKNIPESVVADIITLAKRLGINYAGFDIAITRDAAYLLEFNLLFGTTGITLSSYDLGRLVHQTLQKINATNSSKELSYLNSRHSLLADGLSNAFSVVSKNKTNLPGEEKVELLLLR